ncbi:MAG: class I SAM-dependent methyltransferase [Actinomycetota bacterium]
MSESARASTERFDPATMSGLIAAEHLARYWLAADLASGLDVLDAGCGVGYGAEMIARAGASRVVGIDLSPEAIATASERVGEVADFQVGDVQDLPFDDGSFDLVVCFEVLEHLEDPEPTITALKAVLREGGLLIVSSPNRGVYPPGNPYHLHEFTLEELRDALTARFANVVLMRQHPWLASLIDDGTLTSPGGEPVRASVARAGQAVDAWTYVVALASDGAIDEPGAISVLAETGELHALQEAVGAAEANRDKPRAAHESKQRKLTEALHTANQDRARLRAALEATAMELHDLERSRSWRITRPLRAPGAAFRRLSQWRAAPPKR